MEKRFARAITPPRGRAVTRTLAQVQPMPGPLMSSFPEAVRRRLARTSAPSGLVSIDYLWAGADPAVRMHRHLLSIADPRIPRLAYWPLQVTAYLRFLREGSSRPDSDSESGADPRSVTRRWLRYRHTINAESARRFGLDRQPERWPLYIYDREAGAFHAMRSRILATGSPGDLRRQVAEIQDKARTATALAALGIATPRTYRRTLPGETVDLAGLVQSAGSLFCKPRTGSRGENAFIVETADGGIRVRRYQSASSEADAADYALRQFAARPYLIQQHLHSHPGLVQPGRAADWDVATVRLITHSPHAAGERVYSAILELPRPTSDSRAPGYNLSVVDPTTGTVSRAVDSVLGDSFPTPGMVVPHWAALLAAGVSAHEKYPSIYAIAWDFAITSEAAVLLEGNTGWGVEIPQMAHGPLLRNPSGSVGAGAAQDRDR